MKNLDSYLKDLDPVVPVSQTVILNNFKNLSDEDVSRGVRDVLGEQVPLGDIMTVWYGFKNLCRDPRLCKRFEVVPESDINRYHKTCRETGIKLQRKYGIVNIQDLERPDMLENIVAGILCIINTKL